MRTGGIGAEIAAGVAQGAAFDYLDGPIVRIAGQPVRCDPSSVG